MPSDGGSGRSHRSGRSGAGAGVDGRGHRGAPRRGLSHAQSPPGAPASDRPARRSRGAPLRTPAGFGAPWPRLGCAGVPEPGRRSHAPGARFGPPHPKEKPPPTKEKWSAHHRKIRAIRPRRGPEWPVSSQAHGQAHQVRKDGRDDSNSQEEAGPSWPRHAGLRRARRRGARSRRGERAGSGGRAGLQSPGGSADLGAAAVRQHGRVCVREPRQAGHHDDRGELDALRGARGRAQLLSVPRGRAVRRPHRQRRRRAGRPALPLDLRHQGQERQYLPLQHRRGDQPRRPRPQRHTDVRHRPAEAGRPEGRLHEEDRRRSAGRALARRQGLDAGLQEAPRPGRAEGPGRRHLVRRAGRRPLLPGSAGLRPPVRR